MGKTSTSPRGVDNDTLELNGNTIRLKNSSSLSEGEIPYIDSNSDINFLGVGTSGQFLQSQGTSNPPIWADIIGAPVGAVLPWLKSLTNTPALPSQYVECNGQTIADAESVYNGVTIPDLNGESRFLMGSSTSGTTGGSNSINLTHSKNGSVHFEATSNLTAGYSNHSFDNRPNYYEVVFIMRIK